MKILIVGGGIGGATTALACLEAGFEVALFERADALSEVGAGVQISPNATKVLDRLGLAPALKDIAFEPEALEMRLGRSGRRLFSIPMREEAARRYGAPYCNVHRADLMTALAAALTKRAPNAVHLRKELIRFKQDANQVTLDFADGSSAQGDMLIGADGIHSVVRTELFGQERPRFTGTVAWRLVVPASALPKGLVPPTACIWAGPRKHAVTYYLRRGELVNFVGVVERSDWQNESWTEEGPKAELAADFKGWAKPIDAIVAAASECYRWALFDRDPLSLWSRGRATLVGDACHPMLPFLAQGAAMAIEDAWVLATTLKSNADVTAALTAYESARKPRTTRAQRAARSRTRLYHQNGLAALATYAPIWLAGRITPSTIRSSQDWLFAHDVVR